VLSFLLPRRLYVRGKWSAASIIVIGLVLLNIALVALVAYGKGRFTDTENLMIPLVAFCALLLDGHKRIVCVFVVLFCFLALKLVKLSYQGIDATAMAVLAILNNLIIIGAVFVFVQSFRRLMKKFTDDQTLQRETLYTLIDSLPIYVGMLNVDRKYTMVNRSYETTFGMPRSQIIGKTYDKVLPANITEKHLPMINEAFYGNPTEFADYTYLPDGRTIYAQGMYMPIFNKKGTVDAVATFVTDVTALKDAEKKIIDQNEELRAITAQLQEANHTKDRLFSVISHDLRGPLGSLMGVLELAQDGQIGQHEFKQLITGLVKNVTNNIQLLNNLLYWSKSQMDGISVKSKVFCLNDIIEQNTDLFANQANEKEVVMQKQLPESFHVYGDSDMVDLVVRNLISNAIRYTRTGGILVAVRRREGAVAIQVFDTGIGIREEDRRTIFQEFARLDGPASAANGLGLGLAIVERACDVLGHRLRLRSVPDRGSVFEIIL